MKTMTIAEFSQQNSPDWDGFCVRCGHDYRNGCHGNCTCLSCNMQRQCEEREADEQGIFLLDE